MTELQDIIRQDLGPPVRGNSSGGFWYHCPFHEDSQPSLHVSFYSAKGKWTWHCWTCDIRGDAWDWLVDYRHMDKREAWQLLHGEGGGAPRATAGDLKRASEPFDYGNAPPADEWQDAATRVVLDAAGTLLRRQGRAGVAYDWLLSRGLTDETIRRAWLGWNDEWREVLPGVSLAPGITIPSFVDGRLWYVNVRLGDADAKKYSHKYLSLRGSRLSSLYGADALNSSPPVAILVEGEFDALLLQQFFGRDELAVMTMGSATSFPSPRWKKYLAWVDKLLLCMDEDAAGKRALDKWRELVKWAEVVQPPARPEGWEAKSDVTDFWRAGVDLREWLQPYLKAAVPNSSGVTGGEG